MFTHWNWGWNGGNVYMRGWGLIFVLGMVAVFLGIMKWYAWKHRNDSMRRR